jgi:hypothetical protein
MAADRRRFDIIRQARQRFLRAIGDFARSYEKRSLWQRAAGVYQVGIEVDSLAEEFHRGLMVRPLLPPCLGHDARVRLVGC